MAERREEFSPFIEFGPNANSSDVTPFSSMVLRDILRAAGLTRAVVSSTSRSPASQARVMFNNIVAKGVAAQKRLYGPSGDKVIDVFVAAKAAGKTADEIKAAMEARIIEVGPSNVSHHAADPKVLNVFDVAPSSIANRAAFELAVRSDARVKKFLVPPSDPGYHLEIPQPNGD